MYSFLFQCNYEHYGVDFIQASIMVHPESVVVPPVLDAPDDLKQQIQHILQKDSTCFGVDIYNEAMDYIQMNS